MSKKNAIPPHVSPSTTVYRMGGRGVAVGTGEGVGVADGVRDWVVVGVGDPVGVSAAAAGNMALLAKNVSPAVIRASAPIRIRASLKSRLTWRLAGAAPLRAAPLNSVPQTTQREAPGVNRVPQVGHKEAEASDMGKGPAHYTNESGSEVQGICVNRSKGDLGWNSLQVPARARFSSSNQVHSRYAPTALHPGSLLPQQCLPDSRWPQNARLSTSF